MAYDAPHDDGRRDFHFLYGRWHVVHRRLKARGQGCAEWTEFGGASFCEGRMGGLVNVDEYDLGDLGPGMALRSFDVERRRWAIYWIAADGVLGAPVFGRFERGTGLFLGEDICAGRPVRVRFSWDGIAAGAARWSQAFSYDGGESWETNWIMDFSR
jgi:hypothetical protein